MAKPKPQTKPTKEKPKKTNHHFHQKQDKKPPSWSVVKGLFTCKDLNQEHHQNNIKNTKKEKKHKQDQQIVEEISTKKCKKIKCSGSLCSNTKVMHRPEISASSSSPEVKKKAEISSFSAAISSSSSNMGSNFRGMPFSRFSGCYECRMVVDPVLGFTRDPSLRSSICSCPDCGEIFMKPENLELHQSVRHAVSELGPEDTSKNIVEIIFQSSWLKKQAPICQIDRILKVHNTQRTISKFEDYRDSIKSKANKLPKKHPRCIADGNELLRFYSTSFTCSLGLNGSSNLCNSIPNCNVCSIIKHGFKESKDGGVNGILTTATSGKAHDKAVINEEEKGEKRAMLVCRVIAGRVKKSLEGNMEDYDSKAGEIGVYSNLDELFVFNPKAILPCFVVIYSGF
ncbi:C2H2-like zinc finger protein [Euphorbia peplus]|nr:C2H2-like zinc finger protein [Euphorbia peplus]